MQNQIRNLLAIIFLLLCSSGWSIGQNAPRDWTSWEPVTNDWTEFYVLVEFRGGEKTPADLAKAKLKSLKVECKFIGRINVNLPEGARGAKVFRINFSEYGKVNANGDFLEDWFEVYAEKDSVTHVRSMEVIRPAAQFDVAEASKPKTEATIVTNVPTILSALGVGPITTKVTGRTYRVESEWRRKGNTVEIRLKDYRPQT